MAVKPRFTGGYLNRALAERMKVIERTVKGIRASKIKFDAIAFNGLSGSLIAPSVGDRLKKPLIAVRKEKTTHTDAKVEGCCNLKRYIIIDDQIATGATIQAVKSKVKRDAAFKDYELVGVFLYSIGFVAMKEQPKWKKFGVPVYG